jgi:hypothetical protein
MQYATVAAITVRSAWETLQILDRQAQRDCRKVWQILTCKQAVQTYRSIYRLIEILCLIAIALGATAREMSDSYVASCERSPLEQEILSDPWEAPATVEPETAQSPRALPAAAQPIALLPAAAVAEPPTDADLIAWAKANRALLPKLRKAIGKWSYNRKLREGERSAVLQAMQGAALA